MSGILRRLRKLETQVTDRSGLVPHSEAWFQHWSERLGKFLATGDEDYIKGSSLAFIDESVARYRRTVASGEIIPAAYSGN
jgi:hypothetical protein